MAESSDTVNPNYLAVPEPAGGFRSCEEFYPFYLGEHANRMNRRLHLLGTTMSLLIILYGILQARLELVVVAVLQGYLFAWLGHFVFEKNKPATFRYPQWSLRCDVWLWYETVYKRRLAF